MTVERANTPAARSRSRISVAIINDYEVVVRGLGRMFDDFEDRIRLVEFDIRAQVSQPVDIALYDTFGRAAGAPGSLVDDVLGNAAVGKVVLYSWNLDAEAIAAGFDAGVHGYLSKALRAEELVESIERVHAGERVSSAPVPSEVEVTVLGGDWPGRGEGLTAREAEIVALITRGLSNKQIAERTFLSINSVKSYIRTAYRRMGVSSRSQAVLWGVRHGMAPDPPQRDLNP